ncbi:thioesterase II family protein [Amycolatopsis sp. CA-128772]|uniref:thioesterase II family protein n=1 Tax=Amycolatopsis sp. CA-128772 TaxID=2073159 RepID=UPI0011B04E58|nr:alpha/beta fold hydrolase [Amycolatopsis sp. CA-128772]
MAAHPWYATFAPRPAAPVRLYCLPCAGGSAEMFRPWTAFLPPELELRAIRLPGRHARHPRSAFADFDTAGDGIAEALAAELRPPYVLFGHSMGGLIAYRMLRAIERRGLPEPALFVAASCLVQGIAVDRLPDPAGPDERFLDVLRRFGGMPPEVLADEEVLAFQLPVLRADFRLCRSYVYRGGEPPVRVPLRVMGGTTDLITPHRHLAAWRHHTRRYLGLRAFPGGHFFVRDQVRDVVGALAVDVAELVSG